MNLTSARIAITISGIGPPAAFQLLMADQPAAPSFPYDAPDSNPLIRSFVNLLYAAQVTEYQFGQDADVIRAFHRAMPDLVLHLHADGTLLDVHRASEFNLFQDTAQVLQRNLDELLPREPAQALRAAMERTLRERKLITCDWTLMVDAELKHFEVRVIYLHPQQVLAIVRDMTAQHQALQQLRELPRRLLNAQEDERRRLSSDLHDELGQDLTAILLSVSRAKAGARGEPYVTLQTAETLLQALTQKVRRLAQALHPTTLDELGLPAALNGLLDHFARQTGLRVERHLLDLKQRFSPEIEIAVYRTVQEALTNIAQHARAEQATVEVGQQDDRLLIQISDDGQGFDVDAAWQADSYGLRSMRERASLLGGSLTIESAPGKGTCVHAEWPVNDQSVRDHIP